MRASILCAVAAVLTANVLPAKADEMWSVQQKQELIRMLTAEYVTSNALIPRSKKPLSFYPDGSYDVGQWSEAMEKDGPAARLGDMVQITKVEVKGNKLIFELNHGISGGRRWWHRIQVSSGSGNNRGGALGQAAHAPGGTSLALVFDDEVPFKTHQEIKELLKPVVDFEQRSATELYLDKIEPKFREAIENKKAIVGMDKDMVLLAKGRPDKKVRDFKEGVETEDWIFGKPPGDILFITFNDEDEAIRVRETHANLGGEVHVPDPIERD
jgi:hypothetical protein